MSAEKPWAPGPMRQPRFENIDEAICHAERHLPGIEDDDIYNDDSRWQVIHEIGWFVRSDPVQVWEFICRWGSHPEKDLRGAVACVLLEHMLEYHFDKYFPEVKAKALTDPLFAFTFEMCSRFGQSTEPQNAKRLDELNERLYEIQSPG